ncbi:hypothetical protein ACXR6G_18305 [Ancylomarina sp. YFZ004]
MSRVKITLHNSSSDKVIFHYGSQSFSASSSCGTLKPGETKSTTIPGDSYISYTKGGSPNNKVGQATGDGQSFTAY